MRLLELLLLLYPKRIREAYRREVRAALPSALEIGRRGRLGPVGAWIAAAADLLQGAAVEWAAVLTSAGQKRREGTGKMRGLEVTMSALHIGGRRIRRSPASSLIVVLTLALGIGANAAVFSLVDGVLLKPLPYAEPNDLVFIWSDLTDEGVPRAWVNGSHALELRESLGTFSAVVPMDLDDVSFTARAGGVARSVRLGLVGSDFFEALDVAPRLGRGFLSTEEGPAAPQVAVLTDELWRSAFGQDPDILNRDVRVDGLPYRVVGVMPPDFRFRIHQSLGGPAAPDLFVPLNQDLAVMDMGYGFSMAVMGRIAAGVPHATAFAELDQVAARLGQRDFGDPDFRFDPGYLAKDLVADARPLILLLMAAVGVVLLIVCANVATVFLARGVARQRDSAVQQALGASRMRLVGNTALESLVLSIMGATLGFPLAHLAVRILVALMPADLPRVDGVAVDFRVGLATLVLAVLMGLIMAIAPALLHKLGGEAAAFRGSLSRSGQSGAVSRAQRGLVGAQIALSTALLIVVALIGKSMVELFEVDAGFQPREQLVFTVQAGTEESEDEALLAYFANLQTRISSLPGVESVGRVSGLPISGRANQHHLDLASAPGATGDPELDAPLVDRMVADEGYARAAGLTLVDGRWFEARDMEPGARVAIIDQQLAERFWPGSTPVGSRVGPPRDTLGFRVVGVVRQQRLYDLGADDRPQWWVPHSWATRRTMSIVVDAGAQGAGLSNQVREIVAGLDPAVPVSDLTTMNGLVEGAVSRWRFALLVMGSFGAAALLLAGLGVYGVLAYSVERRTRELGIRMALGAESEKILRMVVTQGLRLVLGGLVVGTLGAWASGRLLGSLLYGVTPRDPVVSAAVVMLLLVCAVVATYLPARRASRIPPMEAFRSQ